ncbi:MAG: dodecin domain-containing protein [Halobacteriales archaeon]|nr:dodecin domain-containing protein [Halobacteriales archaeon]
MAYQKATIIGSSTESFTAAADDAIDRAEEKYGEVKWAETQLRGVEIASVDDREYQVEAVVAYEIT